MGFAELEGELFGLEVFRLADGGKAHAVDGAVLVTGDEAAFGIDCEGHPGAFLIFGDVVELFHLEAFGHGDISGGDAFGRAAVSASGFAVEGEAPGAFAVIVDDECGLPGLSAGFRGLPLAIGFHEDFFLVVGELDGEAGDEGRDAAFVAAIDDDLVLLAALDVLADIHLGGFLPVGIGEDFFAVEDGVCAVVAGQLEGGEVRIVRHLKAVAEGDLRVFVAIFGKPDPLRRGAGGGG